MYDFDEPLPVPFINTRKRKKDLMDISSVDKRRDDLQLAVPPHFRCPISLDVMKSPVSLCTGITYDRTSIEKWLALGNRTCPATMLALPSTDTTPNLTLRRLIHHWLSQTESVQSLPSSPAVWKLQLAQIFNEELGSESLSKVICFLKASEEKSAFFAQSNDAVDRLISFFASRSDEVLIGEQIVEILDLISQEKGVKERLNQIILKSDSVDPLSSFVTVLQNGRPESKLKTARILDQISIDIESKRKILEKPGVLHELHALCAIESGDAAAQETLLSSLMTIASTRPAKKELIRLGIVRTAGKILSRNNFTSTIRVVIEKTMAIVEAVATCTEGRAAISEDGECVREIVRRLMKCSSVATEHGISVLWSVCCLARDSRAQEKVGKENGLTKVLLVMQSDCSECTRRMCVDLIKILRVKSSTRSNLAPWTTHITPY